MERMVVVVFDNEKKAYQGQSELKKLEAEGSLGIYDGAVIVKHADGTVSVKELDPALPVGMLSGSAVGGMIGLLGGPAGLALGAASGLALGAIYDADTSRVGMDFVDDVSNALAPNKVAVVAELEEEWTTPLDTRMEAIGGTVFRRALWEVEEQTRREEIAAMKADLNQMKSEIAKAHADRKAKLQKKVEQLEAKIDAREKKSKERFQAFQARRKAKYEVFKKNAAAAGRALKQLAQTAV